MTKARIDKSKRIPIYQQCADIVGKAIEDGRYGVGEFLPSERQLSQEFEINRLTLRKGLAELVRRGLVESVPGAGNRVVRKHGKKKPSKTIGCLMLRTASAPALSPYFADIFEGVERELSASGYELFFAAVQDEDLWNEDGRPKPNPPVSPRDFAGVLVIGGVSDELMFAYQRKGIPVVAIDRYIGTRSISSIIPDNDSGAYEAGRYLIDLGHKHIAFLGAGHDPVCESRLGGLKRALSEKGYAFTEADLIHGNYEIEPARQAMTKYLAETTGRATAVFAVNDEAAIGAMKAIQAEGLRIPTDVSVVGFDNIAWAAHTEPPLTTVEIQRSDMGRLAARALVGQVESTEAQPSKLTLETRLIVRDSCTTPRGARKS